MLVASHQGQLFMRIQLLLGLLPVALLAAPLPEPILPQGVGVNIHFTRGHEKDLDMIAAAGFKYIRMDFGWAGIERQKGQYDWTAYDELTTQLEKRGMRAIYILDYSNPLYEETVASRNPLTGKEQRDLASPQHPESVAAFAKWAVEAAKHYRGRPILWEMWNEPNISFWKPKPDVQQYITLALATSKAIRGAVPEAAIMGPASSEMPWPFLESFLSSGVLEYLDAVSVHPYRNYSKSPETAAADYQKLRGLIERYAPTEAKKRMPIVSGEWGYASHAKGVTVEKQAAFAVRQQLSNLLESVPISIWYDWKNDGPDPNEREDNFGTVTQDLKTKPAYIAIQTMTRELDGYRIDRRLKVGNETDYVLLCSKSDGNRKLVVWTLGEPQAVALDIGESEPSGLAGVTGAGIDFQPKVKRQLVLELESMPKYITLKGVELGKEL
jgi:hypothetical protein